MTIVHTVFMRMAWGVILQSSCACSCTEEELLLATEVLTSSSKRRLDPLVEMENCGYNGRTTRRVTLSSLIFASASSVKGYQYRMAT